MTHNRTLWLLMAGCLVALACFLCLALMIIAFIIFQSEGRSAPLADWTPFFSATPTPEIILTPERILPDKREDTPSPAETPGLTFTPTKTPEATPTFLPTLAVAPPAEIDQRPVPEQAFDNLIRLSEANYPYQDYYDTAARLGRKSLEGRIVQKTSYTVGDSQSFQVENENVDASLIAVTDHVYFWVQEGLDLDPTLVDEAANRLENHFYPRISMLFGQEWRPGMDNDPHFSILHLIGSSSAEELGYVTSVDEYPSFLFAESNEQEIIYLNMAQLDLGSDLYYGTLVHELQHLIQWYVDPNETTWLNEGLSQLAELYVGLDTADTYEYELRPETRLNTWSLDNNTVDAHYAAAYSYLVYTWEQLGESAIQELSRHPANGVAAVRSVLQGYETERDFEQFTADWAAANYLDDPAAGPRYYYHKLDVGQPSLETRVDELPFDTVIELDQFGVHYVELDWRGPVTITFAGDTIAELIDAAPRNGSTIWFVPGVDDADAQLTAEFDLTTVEQATLRFSAWYDLEEDYDFAYIAASTDNGRSWEFLMPEHSAAGEFGPAFNGRSSDEHDAVAGWLKESISLNSYVGQNVLLRFEVLTDYETDHDGTGQGFALDDISVPEIGYFADVEDGSSGWQASGFVRTGWQLPQQWAVQLIEGGPTPKVTRLALNHLNQGRWPIEIGKGGGVVAIIPLTPFIDEPATYWLHVEE